MSLIRSDDWTVQRNRTREPLSDIRWVYDTGWGQSTIYYGSVGLSWLPGSTIRLTKERSFLDKTTYTYFWQTDGNKQDVIATQNPEGLSEEDWILDNADQTETSRKPAGEYQETWKHESVSTWQTESVIVDQTGS